MTDKFSTLTVVLERDIRDDDAELLLNAIRHIKGVLRVKGDVTDPSEYMAYERAKNELRLKLFSSLQDY